MKEYGLPRLKEYFINNQKRRNQVRLCPLCNANMADRKVTLYKELVDSLYDVYCWLGERQRHGFEMKEIKHLLGKNEYARFGDLVRFGGIVYKPKDEDGETKKAEYGMNMKRAKSFFGGEYQIPLQITLNQITNEIIDEVRVSVRDFPKLIELIRKDGLYDYEKNTFRLPPTKEEYEKSLYELDEFVK